MHSQKRQRENGPPLKSPREGKENFSPMGSGYHLPASKQALHGTRERLYPTGEATPCARLDNIGLSEFLLQITALKKKITTKKKLIEIKR